MSNSLVIDFATWFVFCYFILLNGGYLALNLLSIISLRRSEHRRILNELPQVYSALEIPISILVPAYNDIRGNDLTFWGRPCS